MLRRRPGALLVLLGVLLAALPPAPAHGLETVHGISVLGPTRVSGDLRADLPDWFLAGKQPEAYHGTSVSVVGDVNGDGYGDAVVGALLYDGYDDDNMGRIDVFFGGASGLPLAPSQTILGDQSDGEFALRLAAAGDVNGDGFDDLLVGAPTYRHDGADELGKVFVYLGSAQGLATTPSWTGAVAGERAYRYGQSVSGAGDVNGDGFDDILVGSHRASKGLPYQGRAYLYLGSAQGPRATPSWSVSGGQEFAHLGYSVSGAGDVNGDGFDDILVGAPLASDGEHFEGRATLYLGGPSGPPTTPDWSFEGDIPERQIGRSLSGAGDMNGDGFDDVAINGADIILVFLGAREGLSPTPVWPIASVGPECAGCTLAHAGDVNGDGLSDLLAGQETYSAIDREPPFDRDIHAGRVLIYYGARERLPTTPGRTLYLGERDAAFGTALGGGDVNGDGLSDVLVGSPGTIYPYSDSMLEDGKGGAFLFYSRPGPPPPREIWSAAGEAAHMQLGHDVAPAGDVNGDGFADVIVGAPAIAATSPITGQALVYFGSAQGLGAQPAWTASGEAAGDGFGFSVASAGDVNGDGYGDVVVGAPAGSGRVAVYHGSAQGLPAEPNWIATSDQEGSKFGFAVSTAGDFDGDGYSDLLVGAPFYDADQGPDGGLFFVYYGSPSGLKAEPGWSLTDEGAWAYMGSSVATAGDLDGDGYADIVVGTARTRENLEETGPSPYNLKPGYYWAYVYLGAPHQNPRPARQERLYIFKSQHDAYELNYPATTAGDLDDDGFADIVFGVPASAEDDYSQRGGWAYLYAGGPDGLLSQDDWRYDHSPWPRWKVGGERHEGYFGAAVAGVGDIDGDGRGELCVGGPGFRTYGPPVGQGYLVSGFSAGQPRPQILRRTQQQEGSRFGAAVAGAGDVNGDGRDDLLVGEPGYDGSGPDEGRVALYVQPDADGQGVRARQLREDGATPLAPGAMLQAGDSFVIAATVPAAWSEGEARLEWQLAPLGSAFGAATTISGTGVAAPLGAQDVITASVTMPAGGVYRWRARLQRAGEEEATTTRWQRPMWSGRVEGDVRAMAPLHDLRVEAGPGLFGERTPFTATVASGFGAYYTWDFGDGRRAEGARVSHYYWEPGVYTVTVTAANPQSALTSTLTLTVAEGISGLTATASPTITALGNSTVFSATVAAGEDVAYAWDFGDGSGGTGAAPSHRYEAAGSYTATVTATNAAGVVSATLGVEVVAPLAGLAVALSPGITPLGSATSLSATLAAGEATRYTWDLGDGARRSGPALSHTFGAAGVYTVVVTATNAVSELTASARVRVVEDIARLRVLAPALTRLGEATAFTATLSAGSDVAYAWDFGDGTSGVGGTATHQYAAPGSYMAVVRASNPLRVVTATVAVSVEAAIAGLEVRVSNATPLPGEPVTLTATTTHGTSLAYRWDLGDGTTSAAHPAVHAYAAAGTYTVVVSAENALGLQTASATIEVRAPPEPRVALAGRITDGETPIGGLIVTAYRQRSASWQRAGSAGDDQRSASWQRVGSATSDEGGYYHIDDLPSGIYRLQISDPANRYAEHYYPGAATLEAAGDIPLAADPAASPTLALQVAPHRAPVLHHLPLLLTP
jgi:PKD repeat protein